MVTTIRLRSLLDGYNSPSLSLSILFNSSSPSSLMERSSGTGDADDEDVKVMEREAPDLPKRD